MVGSPVWVSIHGSVQNPFSGLPMLLTLTRAELPFASTVARHIRFLHLASNQSLSRPQTRYPITASCMTGHSARNSSSSTTSVSREVTWSTSSIGLGTARLCRLKLPIKHANNIHGSITEPERRTYHIEGSVRVLSLILVSFRPSSLHKSAYIS